MATNVYKIRKGAVYPALTCDEEFPNRISGTASLSAKQVKDEIAPLNRAKF